MSVRKTVVVLPHDGSVGYFGALPVWLKRPDQPTMATSPQIKAETTADALRITIGGAWLLERNLPVFAELPEATQLTAGQSLAIIATDLEDWDSALPIFVIGAREYCTQREIALDLSGLPEEARQLVEMATRNGPERTAPNVGNPFERLGRGIVEWLGGCRDAVTFVGQCAESCLKLVTGRARWRLRDFFLVLENVGPRALPIVALISFLVGLIIAFLGAVVLQKFAAEYYVSLLVAYGMLREMGAVMAGVIIAGRTGAAFAAEIGSMKVNEEIDALETLGIPPVDFIVLPRMLALFFMMPLLTIYADVIGIGGGMMVSSVMLDIPGPQFVQGMLDAVQISDVLLGIVKGTVFGVLIAIFGCLRGMQCGRSADDVGRAATSAVVSGITAIIIANAIIDWLAAIYDV